MTVLSGAGYSISVSKDRLRNRTRTSIYTILLLTSLTCFDSSSFGLSIASFFMIPIISCLAGISFDCCHSLIKFNCQTRYDWLIVRLLILLGNDKALITIAEPA